MAEPLLAFVLAAASLFPPNWVRPARSIAAGPVQLGYLLRSRATVCVPSAATAGVVSLPVVAPVAPKLIVPEYSCVAVGVVASLSVRVHWLATVADFVMV